MNCVIRGFHTTSNCLWIFFHVVRMLDENFKDQMEEIMKLSPRGRQTMLFSATMTDEVKWLNL